MKRARDAAAGVIVRVGQRQAYGQRVRQLNARKLGGGRAVEQRFPLASARLKRLYAEPWLVIRVRRGNPAADRRPRA